MLTFENLIFWVLGVWQGVGGDLQPLRVKSNCEIMSAS